MTPRDTNEFRCHAVRMVTSSGLTRPQVPSDSGVGLSILNKWGLKHQHDDLMSDPHEDVEKEDTRLRKKVCQLREERKALKRRQSFLGANAGQICFHRSLERHLVCGISLPYHASTHLVDCVSGGYAKRANDSKMM